MTGLFSVIIPTLQRSQELPALIDCCVQDPAVGEVLIINNALMPLEFSSPKVRVLQQDANIFVNPAWNLGVEEAMHDYVALLNDDLEIPSGLFGVVRKHLAKPWVGLVGLDLVTQSGPAIRVASQAHISLGFGTFMAMRRGDFVPVPDDLLIWGGDDWIYWSQHRLPIVLMGSGTVTEMGTTSSSPEFQDLRQREFDAANRWIGHLWQEGRWWHRPVKALSRLRRWRGERSRA